MSQSSHDHLRQEDGEIDESDKSFGLSRVVAAPSSLLKGGRKSHEVTSFHLVRPGDQNGVFYWFGSSGRTLPFRNPCFNEDTNFRTTVAASSLFDGKVEAVLSRDVSSTSSSYVETEEEKGSWVAIELPASYALEPTAYTLSFPSMGTEHIPMNWSLEASVDSLSGNPKWDVLSLHVEDESLVSSGDRIASFHIDAPKATAKKRSRYCSFRVVITGANSSSTYFLVLGGHFELYGKLFAEDKSKAFVSLAMVATAEKRLQNLANPTKGFDDVEIEDGDYDEEMNVQRVEKI